MRALVEKGVQLKLDELKSSDDPLDRQEGTTLKRTLQKWLKLDHPFSYDSEAYFLLCQLVNPTGTSLPQSSTGSLVLKTFMASLIDLGQKPDSRNKCPYIKGGAFQTILPSAIS